MSVEQGFCASVLCFVAAALIFQGCTVAASDADDASEAGAGPGAGGSAELPEAQGGDGGTSALGGSGGAGSNAGEAGGSGGEENEPDSGGQGGDAIGVDGGAAQDGGAGGAPKPSTPSIATSPCGDKSCAEFLGFPAISSDGKYVLHHYVREYDFLDEEEEGWATDEWVVNYDVESGRPLVGWALNVGALPSVAPGFAFEVRTGGLTELTSSIAELIDRDDYRSMTPLSDVGWEATRDYRTERVLVTECTESGCLMNEELPGPVVFEWEHKDVLSGLIPDADDLRYCETATVELFYFSGFVSDDRRVFFLTPRYVTSDFCKGAWPLLRHARRCDIRERDFANARYDGFQLENGSTIIERADTEWDSTTSVSLGAVQYADLDDDGREEALVDYYFSYAIDEDDPNSRVIQVGYLDVFEADDHCTIKLLGGASNGCGAIAGELLEDRFVSEECGEPTEYRLVDDQFQKVEP